MASHTEPGAARGGGSGVWRDAARAGAYLLVALVLGVLDLAVALAALVVALVLVPFGLGVPLVVGAFGLVALLCRLQARRAAWAGGLVVLAPVAAARGLRARFVTVLGDPARWRQALWLVVSPVVAAGAFAVWVVAVAVPVWLVGVGWWGPFAGNPVVLVVGVASVFVAIGPVARVAAATPAVHGWAMGLAVGEPPESAVQRRLDEVTERRRELIDAVAAERRRIERDLHDGVQQRLVALGIDLGMADAKLEDDPDAAARLLRDARDKNRAAIGELRAIGRGLHPAILDDRGLDAALSAVVAGLPIPVDLQCETRPDLPRDVAETAYFVVSEAVANVLKHSGARAAAVQVGEHDDVLEVVVHDDGVGGADAGTGSGLAGLLARVRGVDGDLLVDSPAGGPTTLTAVLPVRGRS